ncbi:signal transduction histidine kinase [Varunaivibrio sulfuroxidans]|uniref:histidine kinase n=2 Tax=Varunaivibrio sulfuroxidans TaxID=1773489 RepID=A0A4R3JE71_9PROT|nr:signal transduction histidine kinase [Varunaivibrio sulfuroxidans]
MMIVLILTPLIVDMFYQVYVHRQEQLEKIRADVESISSLVAKEHLSLFNSAREVLVALSQIPQIRGHDTAACSKILTNVGARFTQYTNFSKVDSTGHIVCSSTPMDKPVDASKGINIVDAFDKGVFSLSGYRIGRLTGKPVIVFSQPIFSAEGQVTGTVNSGLNLNWLSAYLTDLSIPDKASVTVFDRKGVVYASYPSGHLKIGVSIAQTPLFKSVITETGAQYARYNDPKMGEMLVGFREVRNVPGGVFITTDIPKSVVLAGIEKTTWEHVIVVFSVIVLSVLLGWVQFHLIFGRWIERLAAMAQHLAQGDFSARAHVPYSQGELGALAHAFDSMAERLQTHDQVLRQAKDNAEHANHAKSVFLANMNHELRTPLNSINGFAEMMELEMFGALPAQYKEYVKNIHSSAVHLGGVIDDILDMAKVETGKIELSEKEVDVPLLIEDALFMVHRMAKENGVKLKLNIDRSCFLIGDPIRLKQCILNLLSNAIKFSPGGSVTIATRCEAGFILEVRDTGIGMTADDIKIALQPFGHAEQRAFTRRFQGTGLGLPITKQLIEIHGGELIIESEIGRGSTVTIRLPTERVFKPPSPSAGATRDDAPKNSQKNSAANEDRDE